MKLCTQCNEVKDKTEYYRFKKDAECKECAKERAKLYLYPNQDAPRGQKSSQQRRETQARYREKNRDKIRAGQRRYVQENKAQVLARTHKYQAQKLNATPKWLTKEQCAQMEDTFIEAKQLTEALSWLNEDNCPFEVDHIVPLCGENVKGLHVPWNMQIMPRSINRKKHNKY